MKIESNRQLYLTCPKTIKINFMQFSVDKIQIQSFAIFI